MRLPSFNVIMVFLFIAVVGWAIYKHLIGMNKPVPSTTSDINKNLAGMTT